MVLVFQVFSRFSDLLDWGQFDAAVLMVPHHLHEPYARACLHDNKHVLLEKPLAHTVESSLRVLEEAGKSPAVFMVGEQSPYWPEVRAGLAPPPTLIPPQKWIPCLSLETMLGIPFSDLGPELELHQLSMPRRAKGCLGHFSGLGLSWDSEVHQLSVLRRTKGSCPFRVWEYLGNMPHTACRAPPTLCAGCV